MAATSKEKRRKKVIEVLNKARSMELHAIHQYMNQHYGLDDMDYGELAKNIKLVALDEMRHAEAFAERVKELGGEPTTEKARDVSKGQKIEKILPPCPRPLVSSCPLSRPRKFRIVFSSFWIRSIVWRSASNSLSFSTR